MARQQNTILVWLAYLIAAAVGAVPLGAARAATITVNATADDTMGGDGLCTLREAVANVNAAADTTGGDCAAGTGTGDTIDFHFQKPPKNKKQPTKINLVLGKLVLANNVTITGPTAGVLNIFGNHLDRVFEITAGAASISNLHIRRGGAAGSEGGGILVDVGTSLTLTNCTLKGNRASGGFGGAIANHGTVTLTNCVLSSNGAAFGGGGLYNAGMANLTNCTLIRNIGGGIGNFGGTVIVTDSLITLNKANDGGGIGNFGGNVVVINSTFRRNQAFLGATLDNFGGTATLTNCTIDHNSATRFGGILNSGRVTLTNSTLSTNRSSRSNSAALFNTGIATLTNCTITNNFINKGFHGSGIYNVGTATVANTIVASGRNGKNCAGSPIISNGHNLSSDDSCFTGGGTDLIQTDPMLALLENFGGPTDTHALCTGIDAPHPSCAGVSPAIDAGHHTVTGPPGSLDTDQRGEPRVVGSQVDIGAYEAP